MEPSYSVLADMLAKFHTSSEPIQALWLVAVPLTLLGLTWLLLRALRDLIPTLTRRRERGILIYGIFQNRRGLWMVYRLGKEPKEMDWTNPPPELIGRGNVIQGVFRRPEE